MDSSAHKVVVNPFLYNYFQAVINVYQVLHCGVCKSCHQFQTSQFLYQNTLLFQVNIAATSNTITVTIITCRYYRHCYNHHHVTTVIATVASPRESGGFMIVESFVMDVLSLQFYSW